MALKSRSKGPRATSATRRQREIQTQVEAQDQRKRATKKASTASGKTAVQAGARAHPVNPLPRQHQHKPGQESELNPAPQFKAPDYRGSGKLEGRVAIVTGADSGIGRAVAVLFAREGADVGVMYLDEHEDAEVTRAAVEAEGRRCLLIAGDVRDAAFCKRAVRKVVNAFGRLDVLVNNAAFQEHADSLEELTDDHLDMTIRTNLYGYFHMARAALPYLGEGSSIINTGSETGLYGSAKLLDYSATKGAIHAFTLALASNLVKRGIRVNAVAPGPVWTPLNPADRDAADVEQFGSGSPMGRPAQPEEIAPAYVFLAAPSCASYISGVILPVRGGPPG
ncbi:MAG: SDR family oxidoreductase [Fulvimonas sp.]|nr:SDR family oxidoreductase [Fulvimonas sp.]